MPPILCAVAERYSYRGAIRRTIWALNGVRRHLGAAYSVHEIVSRCPQPMHIDTTFVPLAPGKALVNPEFLDKEQLPGVC